MEPTVLIQRLNRPLLIDGDKIDINPFAFGGGLKNGGLSDKAMKVVGHVCSFDYMGSAQFEWGAIPEALSLLIEETDKARISMPLDLSRCDLNLLGAKLKKLHNVEPKGTAMVHIICASDDSEEVMDRVKKLAYGKLRTQEPTRLGDALYASASLGEFNLPTYEKIMGYEVRTVGWLELNNGFLFTTDTEMEQGFADILGIP